MSNIPIRDIAETGVPSGSSYIVYDDGHMKKALVSALADAIRPVASQGEAQAGSDNVKTMTALRVKQSIASEVGATLASKDQGDAANTALQPTDIGVSVQGYDTDLAAIVALSPADNDILQRKSGAWANRTIAQVKTDLAYGTAASLDVGTSAGNVVQLDGSGALPAVDGSQLTGLPGGGNMLSTNNLSDVTNPTTARKNIGIIDFETRAVAAATSIIASQVAIRTAGYSASGDGGGALYKRASVEPTHPGKFQSADGAWWELSESPVTPQMLGAKGDGVTFRGTTTITSGSTTAVITGGPSFAAADIGKQIGIPGAGSAGAVLFSTISSVTNSTTIVLANAAGTSLSSSNQFVCMGTDDTTAINNMFAYSAARSDPVGFNSVFNVSVGCRFPAGNYIFGTITYPGGNAALGKYNRPHIYGDGKNSALLQRGDTALSGSNNILTLGSGVINDTGNAHIHDLHFDTMCSVPKVGGAGIYGYGISRPLFERLTSLNGSLYQGICLNGIDNARIIGCNFRNTVDKGILCFSDGTTAGAGLWIDPTTQITHAGSDGIHIAGGAGGVLIEAYVQDAQRYGINLDKTGYSTERNREIYISPGAQIDNAVTANIYAGPSSIWNLYCTGFTNNGNIGAIIEDQGAITSGDFPGAFTTSGAFVSFSGVRNTAGSGAGIIYRDAGDLSIIDCVICNRYGSSVAGILLNMTRGNLGAIRIQGNRIFGATSAAIVTTATPADAIIMGNILTGNAGGAFINVPTSTSGVWIVEHNRT